MSRKLLQNNGQSVAMLFSERERSRSIYAIARSRALYAIARPSVCLSSVTFVRRTPAVQIFGNISTSLGTLAIRRHPVKISRRSSQGTPPPGS